MTDFEIAFAARCAAITDTCDDSDWLDVQRRVRRSSRRRKITIALIAAAAVLIVAPAFALRGTIIDFFSADPAPANIVREFGSLEVGAPPGMAPGVDPEQARKVASFPFDGKQHVLYVAPTKGGGFCESWTNSFGGCRATRTLTSSQKQGFTPERLRAFYAIGLSAEFGKDGLRVVGGHALKPGSTVQLRYADGESVDIPYVWVSKPIDAGFFLYRVPNAHRKAGHRATSVVVLDKSGNEIARNPLGAPPRHEVTRRLPNGQRVVTPPDAIWAKRRVIIAFRSAITGQMVSLSVAPSRTGGRCYWWSQGLGCPPAAATADPPVIASMSATPRAVRLFGMFAPMVAKAVLNYEDGTSDELVPTEGFVLTEISPDHYRRGHRAVSVVGYDGNGKQLGQSPFNPKLAGLYPCVTPKAYGYGVKQCP